MPTEPRLKTELRRSRQLCRLGKDNPSCEICGFDLPEALKTVSGRFFHAHHVSGRQTDPDDTIILCVNCHLVVAEHLRRAGVPMTRPASAIDRAINLLRAQGSLHALKGKTQLQLAEDLERLKRAPGGICPKCGGAGTEEAK